MNNYELVKIMCSIHNHYFTLLKNGGESVNMPKGTTLEEARGKALSQDAMLLITAPDNSNRRSGGWWTVVEL